MLAQIELAFDKQRSSEDRLRRFLGDASHELRTPLTSIRGYAELLRKDALDDEDARERALARIESESARMGGARRDLVLARMGEARFGSQAGRPGCLGGWCGRRRQGARPQPADHPHRVRACRRRGGRARVEQLIHNLLQNALVHTPAGTPVDVRVER